MLKESSSKWLYSANLLKDVIFAFPCVSIRLSHLSTAVGHCNNNNNNKQICVAPKVVTSEALGPGSVLVSRERRESLGEEERL